MFGRTHFVQIVTKIQVDYVEQNSLDSVSGGCKYNFRFYFKMTKCGN